eukprot:7731935-Pyramimonas_sp.AAC.1
MTSQRRLSRAKGLARLLKRRGGQPKFLTNAAPSSTGCCSPSALRNTVEVVRNLARLGGSLPVTSSSSV